MRNVEESGGPRIVALQGAESPTIQRLLTDFATRMQEKGFKVAGVVEVAANSTTGACGRLAVRDLSSGAIIPIAQELGPGSTACNLDPGGLSEACAAVERAIAAGADVIVLSKFGKQEAAHSGLIDAFRAAFAAELPIATAVSPAIAGEWRSFAGDAGEFVAATEGALDVWWERGREQCL